MVGDDFSRQQILDLGIRDEADIDRWVAACLASKNDGAIVQAINGGRKVKVQRVVNAVNHQFADQIETVGKRKLRVRMFTVPISIHASEMLGEDAFHLDDVTSLMKEFYKHGLIDKRNGGIALLNRLIDHFALEMTSLSDLFMLRQAMFDGAKTGKGKRPYLGDFGVANEEGSWLHLPNGFHTVRHLVGVAYWDENRGMPPMIGKVNDEVVAWQSEFTNMLMLNMAPQHQGSLEIRTIQPDGLFSSVLAATMTMVQKTVMALASEAMDVDKDARAVIAIGTDEHQPGLNRIRMHIHPQDDPAHVIASATIQLSVMESVEVGTLVRLISGLLESGGIRNISTKYYAGALQDHGAPAYLH